MEGVEGSGGPWCPLRVAEHSVPTTWCPLQPTGRPPAPLCAEVQNSASMMHLQTAQASRGADTCPKDSAAPYPHRVQKGAGGGRETQKWGPAASSNPSTPSAFNTSPEPQIPRLIPLQGVAGKKGHSCSLACPSPQHVQGAMRGLTRDAIQALSWGEAAKEKHVFIT